ncbi:MAG: disulfide reductase, partial [Promethearchaeota archaeon]
MSAFRQDFGRQDIKVGVYVCQCGVNIGMFVDCEAVRDFARKLPNVLVSRTFSFFCSDTGQEIIKRDIKELG